MRGAREIRYEYIFELLAEFLVGLDVGHTLQCKSIALAVLYEVNNVSYL